MPWPVRPPAPRPWLRSSTRPYPRPLGGSPSWYLPFCHAPPRPLDAVPAQHGLAVGQLTWVFDQEARLAHELAGLLWQHFERAIAAIVAIRRLVVIVIVVVDDDQALFQDDVEA